MLKFRVFEDEQSASWQLRGAHLVGLGPALRVGGLGHRVLGTKETVGTLSRDQMAGYFDARYSADNTVVALAGRVDFPAAIDQIGRLCADWPRARPTRDAARPQTSVEPLEVRDDDVERAYQTDIRSRD